MQRLLFCSLFAAVLGVPSLLRQVTASERVTPLLNTESTALLGEELLHQGEVYQRAAIHLSEEIEFGKDGEYTLTPGYYLRSGESDGWESYIRRMARQPARSRKLPARSRCKVPFNIPTMARPLA